MAEQKADSNDISDAREMTGNTLFLGTSLLTLSMPFSRERLQKPLLEKEIVLLQNLKQMFLITLRTFIK